MAAIIDEVTLTRAPQTEEATPPAESTPAVADPAAEDGTSPTFGQIFAWSTGFAAIAIVAVSVASWLFYRGDFWAGLGLGAYLAFWFAPAIGLIGGGTYWVTKNPIH